jgi:intein-encoded DNA endonuclease-like protein
MKEVNSRYFPYKVAMALHQNGLGPARARKKLLELGYDISVHTLSGWFYHKVACPGRPWRKKKVPKSARKLTPAKAYLLGILAGDGYIAKNEGSSRTVGLAATDKEFVKAFASFLKRVYRECVKVAKYANITSERAKPVYRAELHSTEIAKDLYSYGVSFARDEWRIPEAIVRARPNVKGAYLRGFFDSEGTVYAGRRSRKYIAAFSTNPAGLGGVERILRSLGIQCRVRFERDCYKLLISGRRNLRRFAELVNFTIRRKKRKLEEALSTYVCTPTAEVDALVPRMIELREQGMTFRRISATLSVHPTTVQKRLRGFYSLTRE